MSGERVLDLFCGAGGLSYGFSKMGFKVLGVDRLPVVPSIYQSNRLGEGKVNNLYRYTEDGGADVVVGGPPCRPWSAINTVRRRGKHGNYKLLGRFVTHVVENKPKAFLMENVPPAKGDIVRVVSRLAKKGYDLSSQVVTYSDFGAATSRRRLMVFGLRKGDASRFFEELKEYRKSARTVREAIGHLKSSSGPPDPDNVFPQLRTIDRYIPYYESGKYGWSVLNWDKPAPSFGNVMKTYTLHPSALDGEPPRVITVKEALLLMGFPEAYSFPPGMGMALRYQMVVDSVSPCFSDAAARAMARFL